MMYLKNRLTRIAHPSGHRWLRYSLRGFLALVVVAALPAWWLRHELDKLAAENDAIAQLKDAGADVDTTLVEPRWFWCRFPKSVAPHQNCATTINAWRTETPLGPRHMPLLARLTHLRQLGIAGSTISDGDLRFCNGLSELEVLDITRCPRVTHVGLAHFFKARGLKRLSLHGTAFTDQGMSTLATFEEIESLMLTSTNVTDRAMPQILSFKRIKRLGLPRGITSAGLRRIGELTELTRLHISLNRDDDVEALTAVCRVPKLTELTIWGDGLTNAGLEAIARAAALEAISIRGAGDIDRASLQTLKKVPKLKYLGLAVDPFELRIGDTAEPHDPFAAADRLERFEAEMAPVEVAIFPSSAGERGLKLWDDFDIETDRTGN